MPREARTMAVRGENPPVTRAFTAFISGFDTFQTPYFKAIHIQYNFFLNIIPKNRPKHNRRMDFYREDKFWLVALSSEWKMEN
jgi:hypothetical protein